jgi:hypothetical protein
LDALADKYEKEAEKLIANKQIWEKVKNKRE